MRLRVSGRRATWTARRSRCDAVSHVKCPPQCPLPNSPLGSAKPPHCRTKLDYRCVGIFGVGIALQRKEKDPLAKRPRKKRVCIVINTRLNRIQLRSGDDFRSTFLNPVAALLSQRTASISGGAQRRPLHAVVSWPSCVARRKIHGYARPSVRLDGSFESRAWIKT